MDYVTIKVWEDTRAALRIIASLTEEQMVQVIDRLCRAELERVIADAMKDGKMVLLTSHTRKGKSFVIDYLNAKPEESGGATDDNTTP